FQAEDGIRDFHVTGVQTCALPISGPRSTGTGARGTPPPGRPQTQAQPRPQPMPADDLNIDEAFAEDARYRTSRLRRAERPRHRKIGRASCRGRVYSTEGRGGGA